MTKKAKASYHFIPIYNQHLFFGNDTGAIADLIKCYLTEERVDYDEFDDRDDTLNAGFVRALYSKKDDDQIVAFILYSADECGAGTLAHEVTHLVNRLFAYVGHELDDLNDEPQAYLVSYIVDAFMESIRGVTNPDQPLKKLKRKK